MLRGVDSYRGLLVTSLAPYGIHNLQRVAGYLFLAMQMGQTFRGVVASSLIAGQPRLSREG
jgi:hypothetical protein